MNAPMFLSKEEIAALTARSQYSAQKKILCKMGIEHRARPDGSVVVLRSHIEQLFGILVTGRKGNSVEPNWGAIHATRS